MSVLSVWIFFILNVFRHWAKVYRTFDRKMSASCQIYNLFVLRKNFEDFEFRKKLLKAFSAIFFENVSSFERKFLRNYILRIRRNNLNFFFGIGSWLKFSELGLNEVTLLAQKFNRFPKLQTTCLEEVWLYFLCVDWIFRFSKFLWFLVIFFAYLDKKTKTGC